MNQGKAVPVVLLACIIAFLNSCVEQQTTQSPDTTEQAEAIDSAGVKALFTDPPRQYSSAISISTNSAVEYQTIDGFGASDAWRCRYVGKNWPLEKREAIADLLFSSEVDKDGNPKGIGLSIWRFNITAGTEEQGDSSNIYEKRRGECFQNPNGTYDWNKQAGQQWFLKAAQKRGVDKFLAFTNSAPVHLTNNGKGYATKGDTRLNVKQGKLDDYSSFLVDIMQHFEKEGLHFDYLSPINEPQWNWSGHGQEGTPASNEDIFLLVKYLSHDLSERGLSTRIVIGEAGSIGHIAMLRRRSRRRLSDNARGNQANFFFNTKSPFYIGDLPNVEKTISAHSYHSVWPLDRQVTYRQMLDSAIKSANPDLKYWQSEYCILQDNDEIGGLRPRDLGMPTALYVARIIHNDLVIANAASWQWWTALGQCNAKDALVYLDDGENVGCDTKGIKLDGQFHDSKLLWALGNYSRFVRPGMVRIKCDLSEPQSVENGLLVSAYKDPASGQLVYIMVNLSERNQIVDLGFDNKVEVYTTSEESNLGRSETKANRIHVSGRSVITVVHSMGSLFSYSSKKVSEIVPGVVITGDTPWIVAEEQPEPVQRALNDVKSDWYKVFGHFPIVMEKLPATWKGAVVYIGQKGAWRDSMIKEPFPGPESFILRIQHDNDGREALVATGADMRGSIYAAYALSEEILGVDPWYYWVDKEPVARNRIEIPVGFNKQFGPPTFKYRGWFMNDEDQLSVFAPDPLRENVFSLDMFDHIYETLLRLRGNMVVPATFPFPDERCQELASRRGLVLNMHHILVLGLNTSRWPKDVPFSYNKYPEIMERYWQTSLDAFKDYEAVWTVGYRGKWDRPFWEDETELKTPEKRGGLITKAIAKQVELIRKVHPNASIISNLWLEGAELYQKGYIKLPENVIPVWPDNGAGIIQDNGRVKAGQGIYYHTAMLNYGANQLSEMVNPARIYREVGRFIDAGATEFFLVNVSDIRAVPLTTDCAMRLVWNAKPYMGKTDKQNMEDFLKDWSRKQFGSDAAKNVSGVYRKYFDIPYMRDRVLKGEHHVATNLIFLIRAIKPIVEKGEMLNEKLLKRCRGLLEFSSKNHTYLSNLNDQAESILKHIPTDRRNFYQGHVLTQIQIHLQLLGMMNSYCQSMIAYNAGDRPGAITHAEKAFQANVDLFDALHKAEYGKWSHWYMGQDFVTINHSYDYFRILLALLRNESPPPVSIRHPERYVEIYKYQEPFSENFPLLYPKR